MNNRKNLEEAIRIASSISIDSSLEDLDIAEDAAYNISRYADLLEDELFMEIYAAMGIRKNG